MRAFSGITLASLCLSLGLLAACQAGTISATDSPSPKIDPQVVAAAQALVRGEPTPAHTDAQGRLQVYIYVTDNTSDVLAKLDRAGLVNAIASTEMRVVQGWIAPKDLAGLAALPCVEKITFPRYATPR